MPVEATKALNASKHATAIATYVTTLPTTPASGAISTYVDLALADQHRLLEVQLRLKDLINRAREEGYRRPSSGVIYWAMPLDGSRADIFVPLLSSEILEGMVAIGISGTVRGGGRGSLILDVCWKEIIDWVNENDRLTV